MSASPRRTALARLLELLSVGLGQDAELVQAVLARADDLERR
jgi:hypothetical protein